MLYVCCMMCCIALYLFTLIFPAFLRLLNFSICVLYQPVVSACFINVLYELRVLLEHVVRVVSVCCISMLYMCCIFCVVFFKISEIN